MIDRSATGVYIAYPTTEVLKPIYRLLKTQVNSAHTKVGITTDSFAIREREYMRTFHGEVRFVPVIVVPATRLVVVEQALLRELCTRYSRVGRSREWFHTVDRDGIAQLIVEIVQTSARDDT